MAGRRGRPATKMEEAVALEDDICILHAQDIALLLLLLRSRRPRAVGYRAAALRRRRRRLHWWCRGIGRQIECDFDLVLDRAPRHHACAMPLPQQHLSMLPRTDCAAPTPGI